jgi:3-hydroxyisobutyrate dehydrogenase-like beta-hydroxyacid dehydrogenase
MKIGIIGLGEMGGAMMDRVLLAGSDAYGYNRTKRKAQRYVEKGMKLLDTPRDVARACDLIITMVTNEQALHAISDGEGGILAGLSPGKYWVEMSTISPDAIRELAGRVEPTGAMLLDSAVLGSQLTVEQGHLVIMLGGPQDACERVQEPLKAIGPTVRRVGDIGHAKVMKISLNLIMPVQILALSEGVILAEKNGIDRKTALEVMLGGVVASPMLKYRAPFILEMPQKAWFDIGMMQKDVMLALELGRESAVPLPTASVANEFLTSAKALGLGDRDFAALFFALATMAGVDATIR